MKLKKTKVLFCILMISGVFTISFIIMTSGVENKQIKTVSEAKSIVEKKIKTEAQIVLKMDALNILSQLRTSGKVSLKLFEQELDLNLKEKKYDLGSNEQIYFYNGYVENYIDSEVYLTIDNYRISGRIDIPVENQGIQSYSISHISEYKAPKFNKQSTIHVIRQINNIENLKYDQEVDEFCELNENEKKLTYNTCDCNISNTNRNENGRGNQDSPVIKLSSTTASGYSAKVKIFADYYYYQHYGDTNYYFMDEINYIIGKWDNTRSQNPDIEISVKSTDIWTSTTEGGGCYSATNLDTLIDEFYAWGDSESIFGTWYSGYYGTFWTGDTDFALLITGKNWNDGLGIAYTRGAGMYSSYDTKYAICELWPGLLTEVVSWGISHEWGHLFTGHHEASADDPGSYGHRAWSWCDLGYFFGMCLGYRQTNMWHTYIFGQSSIGVFSKSGVDGASSANNNIYYIRQWRNNYLRS